MQYYYFSDFLHQMVLIQFFQYDIAYSQILKYKFNDYYRISGEG